MLSRKNEIDKERELNTLYTMIANEKEELKKIKGILFTYDVTMVIVVAIAEAEGQARDNNELTEQLHVLCELTVFLSNMELMVCNSRKRSRPAQGSKELPVECAPNDAYIIKWLFCLYTADIQFALIYNVLWQQLTD